MSTNFYPKGSTMEQIDILVDPVFQEDLYNAEVKMTNQLFNSIQRLDKKTSYNTMLSTLWNTGIPCIDSEASSKANTKSVLKYCGWRGKQVPCAAIFSTYPTDQGMCCTFNMKAADELFLGDTYPQLIQKLQNIEKFTGFNIPVEKQKTQPGKNNGLLVLLDSHSDILSASSIDEDNQGFAGLITQGGNFPQRNFGGFEIKPGHKNIVALSATIINADNTLQAMTQNSRNCYFQWESTFLKIFKKYTHSNCIFECNFFYAQKILQTYAVPCSPWYFPSPDISPIICDPWQAAKMVEIMSNVPINECKHCLSDCESTIFKARISTAPLRSCQLNSFRSNIFCNKDDNISFSSEFLSQLPGFDFKQRFSTDPYFYRKSFPTSQRKVGQSLPNGDVFEITNKPFNAFEKDIASVQIYFDSAYATKIQRSPRMTWIDYFSSVGGIFGLVLGMGIISLFELIWLLVKYLLILRSLL